MTNVTSKSHMPRQTGQRFPLILLLAAAILLVAGVGLWWATASSGNGTAKIGPRLTVDQDKIDFGRVPLDIPVRAVFTVTNAGDKTLTLDASSPIQVLEGC